jgi:hypothetical protein
MSCGRQPNRVPLRCGAIAPVVRLPAAFDYCKGDSQAGLSGLKNV